MAKYTAFVALLFCLLLVAATEMQMAEGKYCSKKNHKWHGPCHYSYKCSQHCKHWFGAKYGICKKYQWGHKHHHWAKYACYCYSPCH
uniref:Defensin-like protein 19 n=1 Tax=Nicotiana tabacum TaxID=4097 RepID=A0A1S4A5U3_TOBAC|nr:defensin-like protein 19 [Nicotiana tomentosiformis]XP_016471980.1 PREDICTED: defensin-like protein 19 [Nicotiana tabacum]